MKNSKDILDDWVEDLSEEEEEILKKNKSIYNLIKDKKIKIGLLDDVGVEEY